MVGKQSFIKSLRNDQKTLEFICFYFWVTNQLYFKYNWRLKPCSDRHQLALMGKKPTAYSWLLQGHCIFKAGCYGKSADVKQKMLNLAPISHIYDFILMLWKTRLLSELHSSTRKESKFIQRTFRVTHAQIYRQMMMAGWKILTYRQILQFKYVQAQIPCSVLCNVTYVNSLFASWPYDGG